VVFLAWRSPAQTVCAGIDIGRHAPLKTRSQKLLFGCEHFVEVNRILASEDKTLINWNAISD
jgi:uracil DNA glycosylase